MLSKILSWCLTAPRSYFVQFSLICLFFFFLQIEFLFPLFIIQNSFGGKVHKSLMWIFLRFKPLQPRPGSPLALCADKETAKPSAPGG